MKFITLFFSSSSSQKSSGKGKKKPPKGRWSLSRNSDTPSFGSSSSSGSSDFFAKAAPAAPRTPRSVLLGRNASCLDAEYWPSPAADVTAKTAAPSSAVSELFGVFDRDGDGKVTKEELEAVLRRLGGSSDPPTEEEVAMIVAEVDSDGDGCISLDDFGALGLALGRCPPGGGAGAELEEELRDAFGVFDADGDGRISAEELLEAFLALGDERCTLEDCRRMIGGVDSHGDGFVRFEDFVRMMDAGRR